MPGSNTSPARSRTPKLETFRASFPPVPAAEATVTGSETTDTDAKADEADAKADGAGEAGKAEISDADSDGITHQ